MKLCETKQKKPNVISSTLGSAPDRQIMAVVSEIFNNNENAKQINCYLVTSKMPKSIHAQTAQRTRSPTEMSTIIINKKTKTNLYSTLAS